MKVQNSSNQHLVFIASTDLGEIVQQFKKFAANLLICLFLITSLGINDSANFQSGKVSSIVVTCNMREYTNFPFSLKISPFAVFEQVLNKHL